MSQNFAAAHAAAAHGAADLARRAAFRPILRLLVAFLALSATMIVVLIVTTLLVGPVDVAVWIRCSFVLASAIVQILFARGAARGSRASWARLAIIAPVIVVAVVVVVSIPDFLPAWVRVEQAVCGAIVLPVAVLALLPRVRTLFPRHA
ncbi:hypothetical protein [Isoptericola sp. NPDC057191]|uniref:hypothetical protein n=1 Tax=Isoptericola sp. NPDC057191 TaxID=3346041 RepID=UPI003639B2B6